MSIKTFGLGVKIAAALGISPRRMNRWLQGVVPMPAWAVEKAADQLGVDPGEFLRDINRRHEKYREIEESM